MSDDRDTNPDLRSPIEALIYDVNELKDLARASTAACESIGPRVRRLEWGGIGLAVVAIAAVACEVLR